MIDIEPFYNRLEAERIRIHNQIDDWRDAQRILYDYETMGIIWIKPRRIKRDIQDALSYNNIKNVTVLS